MKMNELESCIKDLRNCATTLNSLADFLFESFSGEEPPKEPEVPKLTLEEVRATLANKSRAGYTAEIRVLLNKYGAQKLSEVDPQDYDSLLFDAEALGNE